MRLHWQKVNNLPAVKYTCGYCGLLQSPDKGYTGTSQDRLGSHEDVYIYICSNCDKPTFFYTPKGDQTPAPIYGENVGGIDDENTNKLFQEARNCVELAPTSAIMACRKILMHVAVVKGAKQNLAFGDYVKYLSDNNFVPPDSKDWVDYIRQKGNEANHQIVLMSKDDAKNLLDFTTMLLKVIFEYPSKARKLNSGKQPQPQP